MEPKLLCGLLLTLVGLVFSSICFIYAVMNPWNYNGINVMALTACWAAFWVPKRWCRSSSPQRPCARGSSSASMWRSTRTIRINNLKP